MSSYVRTSRKTKAVNGLFEVVACIYGILPPKERTDVDVWRGDCVSFNNLDENNERAAASTLTCTHANTNAAGRGWTTVSARC